MQIAELAVGMMILETGTIEFTFKKVKYALPYSITNDRYCLFHLEEIAYHYGDFVALGAEQLEKKIISVASKKIDGFKTFRYVSADRYYAGRRAGTLPNQQSEEVTKSEEYQVTKSEDEVTKSEDEEVLVTKTPGYTRRTSNPNMGRPSLGTTKKVSLTLSDDTWALIEARVVLGESRSAVIRELIEGRII